MSASDSEDGMAILRSKRSSTGWSDPTVHAEWSAKKLVWIPHERDVFTLASMLSDTENDDGTIDCKVLETGEKRRVLRDDMQKPNPPKFEKVEDMADLTFLNEASVLHNLRQRYNSGMIYTYSGLFCVVVNPYQRQPIYTLAVAETYRGKNRRDMPPHIFAVADTAYRHMLHDKEDQSILCTGESGAGKTENTKKVIQYLAHVAGSTPNRRRTIAPGDMNKMVANLEDQLLQANPILEAFGNSKTVKNDNSSRFGKFIRIHFDGAGAISGANIEFYLLEKTRVLRQATNERTFHVFYQLLRGATEDMHTEFSLEPSPSSYSFLSNGDVPIVDVDDSAEFRDTLNAMQLMGFEQTEINGVFRLVSSVLLLGQLPFCGDSEQASLSSDEAVQRLCHLLGVNMAEFMRALLKPKIKVAGEDVVRHQSLEAARASAESLAAACYERLFRWLVARINKSLDKTRHNAVSFIGILDIAGFEIFDVNSFEQLCINVTNEKLQQLFNKTMFIQEQEEYQREGLEWTFIDFGLDLQPCIDLIDRPMGILSLLDEECLFPKATDQSFVSKLHSAHKDHPKYIVPKPDAKSKHDFSVIHYAGRVDYSAAEWRHKNMDPLNESCVQLLQNSAQPLVQDIWKNADFNGLMTQQSGSSSPFGSRIKKGMFRTVSQTHKEQLNKLMTTLNNTNPHFVRCFIPNHDKKPNHLVNRLVLDQLSCNGVMEGIRICRKGYPNRMTFQDFRNRYESLLARGVNPAAFMDGKVAVTNVLNHIDADKKVYCIGHTKVFFKAGCLAVLEQMRDKHLSEMVIQLQATCRRYLVQQSVKKRKEQEQLIKVIQRNGLAWIRVREWQWWRLFNRVKPLLAVTHSEEAMAAKEVELRDTATRLHTTQSALTQCTDQIDRLATDMDVLRSQLDQESVLRAAAEEGRISMLKHNERLKQTLEQLESENKSEAQRAAEMEKQLKEMQHSVSSLTHKLKKQDEKQAKAVMDKVAIEQKLRQLEMQAEELQSDAGKAISEKHDMEKKHESVASQLAELEQETHRLRKQLKAAAAKEQELIEQSEKDRNSLTALETIRRQLENSYREEIEKREEAEKRAADIRDALARKDRECADVQHRFSEEQSQRQAAEKKASELLTELEDAKDDLAAEKAAKERALKAHRDELAAYKAELDERDDNHAKHAEQHTLAQQELENAQRQLGETHRAHEERVEQLKGKHAANLDKLQQEIARLNQCKQQLEKQRDALLSQVEELKTQLAAMEKAKCDQEKRRRLAEQMLNDMTSKETMARQEADQLRQKHVKMVAEAEELVRAKESSDDALQQLDKMVAAAELRAEEARDRAEEESRRSTALAQRIRSLEDELSAEKEQVEEWNAIREKAEKEREFIRKEMDEMKTRLEEEAATKEEETRRRLERDIQAERQKREEAESTRDREKAAKKKAQQEAEDLAVELEAATGTAKDAERRQRKWEQQLAEKEQAVQRAERERDAAAAEKRDAESRVLTEQRERETLETRCDELERAKRTLQQEIDTLASNQDDVGKTAFELEKFKRRAEEDIARFREQIIELEDAVTLAEDGKSRVEVNWQAARAEWERERAQRDEEHEEKMAKALKKMRELEDELDAERKARASALAGRKKAEMAAEDQTAQIEKLLKEVEDMTRQVRRAQRSVEEANAEGDEARAQMNEALAASRDAEKKVRLLEAELKRIEDDLVTAQHGKRKAETERDELADKLDNSRAGVSSEERRRLESRISELQFDLEEEQTEAELLSDKYRKAQSQVESLSSELAAERRVSERLETEKDAMEREWKEARARHIESESAEASRLRKELAAAEARAHAAESSLYTEEQEKQRHSRTARKLENSLKDLQVQLDEANAESKMAKEQANSLQDKLFHLKIIKQEVEEDLDKERKKTRNLQRTIDANDADMEKMRQEKIALQQSLRAARTGNRRAGFGSSTSMEYAEFSPSSSHAHSVHSGNGNFPEEDEEVQAKPRYQDEDKVNDDAPADEC